MQLTKRLEKWSRTLLWTNPEGLNRREEGKRAASIVVAAVILSVASAVGADDRSDFVLGEIDRFNPEQSDPRAKEARRLKLCKLAESPWLFYRGTNHLYWADFSLNANETHGPDMKNRMNEFGNEHTKIWLQGDLHAENFGAYLDAKGKVVYGLNDFDESVIADYPYDVWRMAISLVLIADQNGQLGKKEQKKVVRKFARAYLEALESFDGNDNEIRYSFTHSRVGEPLKEFLKDTETEESRVKMLNQQTTHSASNSKAGKFDRTKPNFCNLPIKNREEQIKEALKAYRHTLADPMIGDDRFFEVKDIALRVGSGTGGLNAERYYVLIEGESPSPEDDRILDIKEQSAPSALQFLTSREKKLYDRLADGNHAKRQMLAYLALVANPDPLLGWLQLPDGKQFSVRERSPYKASFRVLNEEKKDADGTTEIKETKLNDGKAYEAMAKEWGRILAAAHAGSDQDFNPQWIDYSFEKQVAKATDKKKFAELTVQVAMQYAERVVKDHDLYKASINQKFRIDCPSEILIQCPR